jgi:bifunctional non-homologous end joining protein LigD
MARSYPSSRTHSAARGPGSPFPIVKGAFQLATLVDEAPHGPSWVFERKLDGYRAMAEVREDGQVRLLSRNGLSFTERFPTVARALGATKALWGSVVDGEIVAYEDGVISFEAMQRAQAAGERARLEYLLFDLLAEDGKDLRSLPLRDRKARLLARAPHTGPVRAIGFVGSAERALAEARALGDEGVIAKRADAPYRAERSLDWLKIKLTSEDDFVVIGLTPSKNDAAAMGSLVLATRARPGGPLVHAGRVGTGFDLAERRALAARLRKHALDRPPVEVPREAARGVRWTEPRMVVRVAYTNLTTDGLLRHPTFRGERIDADARNVARERKVGVDSRA